MDLKSTAFYRRFLQAASNILKGRAEDAGARGFARFPAERYQSLPRIRAGIDGGARIIAVLRH